MNLRVRRVTGASAIIAVAANICVDEDRKLGGGIVEVAVVGGLEVVGRQIPK